MRSADTTSTITSSEAWVLPFVALWLLGAGPPLAPVGVALPPVGNSADGAALTARVAELVAIDLARLGLPRWSIGDAGERTIRADVRLDGDRLALSVRVGARTATSAGPMEDLDRLACVVARQLAPSLGLTVPEGAELLLGGADPAPAMVHLALGHASLDVASGQTARARMRFGRAEEIWRGTLLPEAIDGANLAQVRGAADPAAQARDAGELARAALEKAEFGARSTDRGIPSLAAALRFLPDRALAWSMPLDPKAEIEAGENVWWLGDRAIEPRTGAVVRESRGKGRRLGELGAESLRLDGANLLRVDASGALRWKRGLPWKAAKVELGALAGGFVLTHGAKGLAWIDASTGAITQSDPGVVVLAVGLDGALVETGPGKIALVRPGRTAPAWTQDDPTRGRWILVPGRAIELEPGRARVVDTHDGKPRGAVLAMPEGARIIGAEGRYAVIGAGSSAIAIDALAGAELTRVVGPAEATIAAAGEGGFLIGFATGDLATFDREGARVDRLRVFGRPLTAWSGRPHAPGFLVRTEAGLFALGPVPTPERPRDVEVALLLASRLEASGDLAGARRWAEHVARAGAGRIAEAEALRARTYASDQRPAVVRARAAAERRAKAASDLTTALPAFGLE